VRRLPPDPTNPRVVSVSATGTVSLTWDYDFGLEFGFVIVRDGIVIDTVDTNQFVQDLTLNNTYDYSIYAYNEFGNTEAVNLSVKVWPTSVENRENDISVYPSVTIDRIYFRNLPENSRIVVVDLAGRAILSKSSVDLSDGLSLEPYAKGYYLVKVMKEHELVKMIKVVKQ
jgi:hypothetical protein